MASEVVWVGSGKAIRQLAWAAARGSTGVVVRADYEALRNALQAEAAVGRLNLADRGEGERIEFARALLARLRVAASASAG